MVMLWPAATLRPAGGENNILEIATVMVAVCVSPPELLYIKVKLPVPGEDPAVTVNLQVLGARVTDESDADMPEGSPHSMV